MSLGEAKVKFGDMKVKTEDSEFSIEHDLVETLPCGRFLALSQSKKDGGKIAVIGTPISLGLAIADIDSDVTAPGAFGFSKTPRGWHFYFAHGDHFVEEADKAYERCSVARGWYAERLFNKDGSPRSVPSVLVTNNVLMIAHRNAFIKLQNKAYQRGLHVPQPSEEVVA